MSRFKLEYDFPNNAGHLVNIDRNALDVEVEQQPALLMAVTSMHAKALNDRDAQKVLVAETYAKLYLHIKKKALDDGTKLSEEAIKQRVIASQQHRDAQHNFLVASNLLTEWSALRESVVARGHALKTMVDLWSSSYFASSSVTVAGVKAEQVQVAQAKTARAESIRKRQAAKADDRNDDIQTGEDNNQDNLDETPPFDTDEDIAKNVASVETEETTDSTADETETPKRKGRGTSKTVRPKRRTPTPAGETEPDENPTEEVTEEAEAPKPRRTRKAKIEQPKTEDAGDDEGEDSGEENATKSRLLRLRNRIKSKQQ